MNITQDLFRDLTLPILKEDISRTSQFDPELLHEIELASKRPKTVHDEGGENLKITFNLPNRLEPITICNKACITLGRADRSRNAVPTIDFTDDEALELGVSRLHAKILFVNNSFHLKDMGSTNGTWLNGTRLAPYEMLPIQEDDQICLGRLVMIVA